MRDPAAGAAAVEAWFAGRGWRPAPFQRAAWRAYLALESGLIHAPTGTGKSLAAFLGPVIEAYPTTPAGLWLLWITPLRALAADTAAQLAAAVAELHLAWTVETRTGDTHHGQKTRQRRRLPTVLVTTPESLALLLSYGDTARQLQNLQGVVVDEWHELLGSKRGVQLELCLARLREENKGLRIWGLSATLGNTAQALEVLLGPGRRGRLVAGPAAEPTAIETLLPSTVDRFPWAGHLGLKLLPEVVAVLEDCTTALLFTNTRAQAELWYQGLLVLRPQWEDAIALHHGAIAAKARAAAEEGLRAGTLRCVVCTSSLDLGVDFAPVERVIQVGSPKGIARLLQRAGRSGHRPGAASAVWCVPTHALELVEIAAARRAAAAGRLEARPPLTRCLDVLVQHLVTLAVGGGFDPRALACEVRTTHAFATLSEEEWRWALDFVTRGGDALQHYDHYRRVDPERGFKVGGEAIARRHRLGIGTITANHSVRVRWLRGGELGTVEENFIARLQPGERFIFAGRLLELAHIKDMVAYVRTARGTSTATPRWTGSRLPFSATLADEVLALLANPPDIHGPELAAVAPLLALQARWSSLPSPEVLLVEHLRSREGDHLFCYPFAGRQLHEGLGALVAYRLSRRFPLTYTISCNDYGFELLTHRAPEGVAEALEGVLAPAGLTEDLVAAVNLAELARRQFRDIARIAGLVFQGYPGSQKSQRQIQASSGLIYDVLVRYDGANQLLAQAEREVLDRQLATNQLGILLEGLQTKTLRQTHPPRLTPLAFPLWAERIQFQVSSEGWKERVQRMAAQLEGVAGA